MTCTIDKAKRHGNEKMKQKNTIFLDKTVTHEYKAQRLGNSVREISWDIWKNECW